MALTWIQGDLITADRLNTENGKYSIPFSVYIPDGFATIEGNSYFYSTIPAGIRLFSMWTKLGWSGSTLVRLYRYENGSFVQKWSNSYFTGWNWNEYTWNVNSYGVGQYLLYLYQKHSNGNGYPSSVSCVKGNSLYMMSDMKGNGGVLVPGEAHHGGKIKFRVRVYILGEK